MKLIRDLGQLEKPLMNPVLTIGNFDGVHRGHLALFDRVKARARLIQGQSAVMTFEPHPIKVMKPGNGPPLITMIDQKLELISAAGIDVIFCLPFTKQFAAISAQSFVRSILLEKIGMKELVVGYDYAFGHQREGDIKLLKAMGRTLGFAVHEVKPIHIKNKLVSSTSIRKLIQEGNLGEAKALLGRDYQISGTVVRGKSRGGKLLGFPTANLELIDELTPKSGVYAVTVLMNGKTYKGVTNIGFNPTFGNGVLSVETHILDFSEDVLGKSIKINFIQRLREEKKYASIHELAEQIALDIAQARKIFENLEAPT
ncbi:MAG: bifunctional riboflavin kinase/FAD synthetase [Desulfatiglandaceae bacterium]